LNSCRNKNIGGWKTPFQRHKRLCKLRDKNKRVRMTFV
jgi:hypothetical protein